jgi:hypothetical protein
LNNENKGGKMGITCDMLEEKRNTCRPLMENLKEIDHLEDQGKREDNTKSDLQETGWDGMHWIVCLIVEQCWAPVNMVKNF